MSNDGMATSQRSIMMNTPNSTDIQTDNSIILTGKYSFFFPKNLKSVLINVLINTF